VIVGMRLVVGHNESTCTALPVSADLFQCWESDGATDVKCIRVRNSLSDV
jgi:hypothetical protein